MLDRFIKDQLEKYLEPERQGTPRGEPIGFSKSKIHACLLTGLTNLSLKQISEKINVAFELIRSWRVGEEFQKKEEIFRQVFRDLYISKFLQTINGERKSGYKELEDDFKLLNPRLMDQVLLRVPDSFEYSGLCDKLRKIFIEANKDKRKRDTRSIKAWEKDEVRLEKDGFKVLIKIIEDPHADPAKRKRAIDILKSSTE
jgi:hypothetical protein